MNYFNGSVTVRIYCVLNDKAIMKDFDLRLITRIAYSMGNSERRTVACVLALISLE